MKIRIEFKYSRQVFCWKKRSIGSALLLSGLRASAFGDIWEKLKLPNLLSVLEKLPHMILAPREKRTTPITQERKTELQLKNGVHIL